MKLKKLTPVLTLIIVPATAQAPEIAESHRVSYFIGAVIALFILGYLIYSLLKPDKF
jgi:K+-transporting ATPase KdpF subunit